MSICLDCMIRRPTRFFFPNAISKIFFSSAITENRHSIILVWCFCMRRAKMCASATIQTDHANVQLTQMRKNRIKTGKMPVEHREKRVWLFSFLLLSTISNAADSIRSMNALRKKKKIKSKPERKNEWKENGMHAIFRSARNVWFPSVYSEFNKSESDVRVCAVNEHKRLHSVAFTIECLISAFILIFVNIFIDSMMTLSMEQRSRLPSCQLEWQQHFNQMPDAAQRNSPIRCEIWCSHFLDKNRCTDAGENSIFNIWYVW